WAPVVRVVLSSAAGLVGQQIARAGFAIIQPVSFIAEEAAKDGTSSIALGREIAEKNKAVPPPSWPLRLALPLGPAGLMALADARRRPIASAVVYGVGGFTLYAWVLSTLPASAPPTPARIARPAAVALTAACRAPSAPAPRV